MERAGLPEHAPRIDSFDDVLAAYRGRRVLVTGMTGFKGSWLAIWLARLKAEVTGFALPPPVDRPTLFQVLGVAGVGATHFGDVRDLGAMRRVVEEVKPEVIFHLAAQPLVRASYEAPLDTFAVNIMGTANLLEAVRLANRPCAVVTVTSDKCYEPRAAWRPFQEGDPLGGHDPYAASKAGAELVAASYSRSFFPQQSHACHGVALATVRAGNVIGGGDWASDRILPDLVRALTTGRTVTLRSPEAVRPWQHVLEPLAGYLELGARLMSTDPQTAGAFSGAWNFGPQAESACSVRELVELASACWTGVGNGKNSPERTTWQEEAETDGKHESAHLTLSIDKVLERLLWRPRWSLKRAVAATMDWYRVYYGASSAPEAAVPGAGGALAELTAQQIVSYQEAARALPEARLAS